MSFAAICVDCGVNTAPDEWRHEWYMVHDSVWCAAGMPRQDPTQYGVAILCIGCLEGRLGRRLTRDDFTAASVNRPDRWKSARLNARLDAR